MTKAWVLVLGMHRSGTSATTGVLHSLGLSLPEDLMTGRDDNHEHYESVSLTDANDSILQLIGGTWVEPPALPPHWEESPDLAAVMRMAARTAGSAFPRAGVAVWKDPRNSLLLPYWARVLAPILGIVLPWRDPLAVARSLEKRDGIPVDEGLALWHRYNESALRCSQGYEVLVVNYDDMVEDPVAVSSVAAAWLERVVPGLVVDGTGVAAAAATVSPLLRHESRGERIALPPGCEELKLRLIELGSGRGRLESVVGSGRPAIAD